MKITKARVDDYWPSQSRSPLGIYGTLSWAEVGALFRLLDDYKISTFIEFGLYRGGLASMMIARTLFDYDFLYFGVENDINRLDYRVVAACNEGTRANIYVGDVFADDVKTLVGNYARRRPTLIFCNASDRYKELIEYLEIVDSNSLLVSRCIYDGDVEYLKTRSTMLTLDYLENTRLVVFRK